MSIGIGQIEEIIDKTKEIKKALHDNNFKPAGIKENERLYSMKEAERMIKRSAETIRRAENEGKLPKPELGNNNRRIGFDLATINQARTYFDTLPHRKPDDEPIVLAVINLKGGVAKSTVCIHLGEYLAERGYRVLVVDADPQASLTSTMGYVPDDQIEPSQTLYPFFGGEAPDLRYCIRKTYWEGMDLIPSNLWMHDAEFVLANDVSVGSLELLREGIGAVRNDYDVIIMDPSPSLGFITLNVLYAANSLIIPMPPVMYDFSSTVSFLNLLHSNLEILEKRLGGSVRYQFIRILMTRFDENKAAQAKLGNMLEDIFGNFILKARMKESAEITNASNLQRTIYELNKPVTSYKTHHRCRNSLDSVNAEIETLIRKCWPSHQRALRHEGVI